MSITLGSGRVSKNMSREGKENTKVRAKEVGKKISECFLKIFLAFYLAKYIGNISGFLPRWLTATTNDLFLCEQLKPGDVMYGELLCVKYGIFISM